MNLVREIRNAAMKEYRPDMRSELRAVADQLEASIEALKSEVNPNRLAATSGLWARGLRILDASLEPQDPEPFAGTAVEPQYRMAA